LFPAIGRVYPAPRDGGMKYSAYGIRSRKKRADSDV
jgi:hypothetical protein